MRLSKSLLLLSFILTGFFTNAQKQITGLVLNERRQPLEAVYIYNLNSKSHAHSLENGSFVLENTLVGDSLKIGLLGYENKIIVLDKLRIKNSIEIVLKEKSFQLEEMIIREQIDAASTITKLDIKTNPVNSSQELLRKVPGLIIGQHAGGGKAEQLFLRGFDIDHGTDISIAVDGIPVNMVSHSHGQGYSDLHFLIPELVNKIDFGKGPYYSKVGDFNTAGYVGFSTKDYFDESSVTLSVGQFNTLRTLGVFNFMEDVSNKKAYLALEYLGGDGPFESAQNFNRLNIFGKYTYFTPKNDKLTITASHFNSRWDASGQIPQREVDNGNISRFGAIDDTEGGITSRTNINVTFNNYLNDKTTIKSNVFFSDYEFELYSNFTFFLEDPVNGDQIKQKESRNIFGLNTVINHNTSLGNIPLNITGGLNMRYDVIKDSELSKTLNRKTILERVQFGDINQTNFSSFLTTDFDFGKFKADFSLRLDHFRFLYNDKLQEAYTVTSKNKTIINPKLNVFYTARDNMQLFLKSGIGFHSNDARVVVTNQEENTLPKAYGLDIGYVWKPFSKLFVNSTLWYLFSEQEFVYVGDAGIVEPSGKTERYGLDLGFRYQCTDWLFIDTDATLTKARAIDSREGQNYIPLAPHFTMSGGISVSDLDGFSGGVRYRFIDDRPANEDNTIIAEGYFVTDFNVNYYYKNITLGLVVENIFDIEWNETQFATESRLRNETNAVEEIHFTPGTPFFVKGTISYRF